MIEFVIMVPRARQQEDERIKFIEGIFQNIFEQDFLLNEIMLWNALELDVLNRICFDQDTKLAR